LDINPRTVFELTQDIQFWYYIINILVGAGYVNKLDPVTSNGLIALPFKVTKDGFYEDPKLALILWLFMPRSLIFLFNEGSNEPFDVRYGLRKFGDTGHNDFGSEQIRKMAEGKLRIESIRCLQKHNGEAGTISAIKNNETILFIFQSKNIPLLAENLDQVNKDYKNIRFNQCKTMAVYFFENIFNLLSSDSLAELVTLLLHNTVPLENISSKFQHIATENAGLRPICIRNSCSQDIPLNVDELNHILDKNGMKPANEYSLERVICDFKSVIEAYDTIPGDKPPKSDLEEFITTENLLDLKFPEMWTFVVLIITMIRNPEIIFSDLLKVATGSPDAPFQITEGSCIEFTIISADGKRFVVHAKAKDNCYWILRAIRTQVEKHMKGQYRGAHITSASLVKWLSCCPSKWEKAFQEMIKNIEQFMFSLQFEDFRKSSIQDNPLKICINAPSFFRMVSDFIKIGFKKTHDPIVILTTNDNKEIVEEFINTLYISLLYAGKSGKEIVAPQNVITIITAIKAEIAEKNINTISKRTVSVIIVDIIPVTSETKPADKVFKKSLETVATKRGQEVVKTFEHLRTIIDDIIAKSIPPIIIPAPTVSLVQHFEPSQSFSPEVLSCIIPRLLQFSPIFPKELYSTDDLAASAISILPNVARNPNASIEIAEKIFNNYLEYGSMRTAVFITGAPGIGKDTSAQKSLKILIQKFLDAGLDIKISIINQDQSPYNCDRDKYIIGLKEALKNNDILIITRNGAGSNPTLKECSDAEFRIHLIAPADHNLVMFIGCIQASIQRKRSSTVDDHPLNKLEDNHIISLISGFIGSLQNSHKEIMDSIYQILKVCQLEKISNSDPAQPVCQLEKISNSDPAQPVCQLEKISNSDLTLDHDREYNDKHITIRYGTIPKELLHLVDTECTFLLTSHVSIIGPNNYKLKFDTVKFVECNLLEDQGSMSESCSSCSALSIPFDISKYIEYPHITMMCSENANPVQSSYWMAATSLLGMSCLKGMRPSGSCVIGDYTITVIPATHQVFTGKIEISS